MTPPCLSNTLSVEANVGAGKSTLLTVLRPVIQRLMDERRSGCRVHTEHEPVEQWKHVGPDGINVLEAFYKNPSIAYVFQSYVYTTRLRQYAELIARMGILDMALIERSVFGDHTMAENCRDSKLITDIEFACYEAGFQALLEVFPHRPLGHIYIDTPPELCIKRIRGRARAEEACMTSTLGDDGEGSYEDPKKAYKYIYDIHNAHRRNFATKSGRSRRFDLPVLTLDGSQPFHTNPTVQLEFATKIIAFYDKLNH